MTRVGRPPTGRIIVTIESQDEALRYEDLGVTFDSSDQEILEATQPVILEQFGANILEGEEEIYTVRKAENSRNTYIYPKSPAGVL